jgi:hypothetical protein
MPIDLFANRPAGGVERLESRLKGAELPEADLVSPLSIVRGAIKLWGLFKDPPFAEEGDQVGMGRRWLGMEAQRCDYNRSHAE